jgi:serine protease
MRPIGILAGLSFALFATLAVAAPEFNPARQQPTTDPAVRRLIVKLRPAASNAKIQSAGASASRVQSLAARVKVNLVKSRAITQEMHVMKWEPQISGESADVTLQRLRADPEVEYAEPDLRRYPHAAPSDPLYTGEWYLQNAQPAATNAVAAWDTTTGSNGVVVAVLDTGIRYGHTDLRKDATNRLLPGFDFVSQDQDGEFITAADGTDWDSDPTDPGDFVDSDAASRSPFTGCQLSNSSWHGTRVSGMIGALSNNSAGVAGMTWSGWILPVRVLGKCGGYDSDIISAMLWAGGIHVDGAPDNPFPAQVENLSLGSTGSCLASYQSVVNQLLARGVLIVASAGNESGPVGAPANCAGVAAIAGIRHVGTKVGFSSLGPQIALSAPGGNCVNPDGQACLFSLDTTTNAGSTTPQGSTFTDQFNRNVGTSFSAPIVSGIAGLMLAANGNLKAQQLIARLKEGAMPFPVSSDASVPTCSAFGNQNECNCTTTTCGAGMANAARSVAAALRPIAAVAVPTSVSAGQDVVLNASGSGAACNHSVSSYAWTLVNGTLPSGIDGANTSTATVSAPSSGQYTVRVTVTDETGKTDTADVVVSSTAATTTAPAAAGTNACLTTISYSHPVTPEDAGSSSSGSGGGGGGGGGGNGSTASDGGGGGALDLLALIALAMLFAWNRGSSRYARTRK